MLKNIYKLQLSFWGSGIVFVDIKESGKREGKNWNLDASILELGWIYADNALFCDYLPQKHEKLLAKVMKSQKLRNKSNELHMPSEVIMKK